MAGTAPTHAAAQIHIGGAGLGGAPRSLALEEATRRPGRSSSARRCRVLSPDSSMTARRIRSRCGRIRRRRALARRIWPRRGWIQRQRAPPWRIRRWRPQARRKRPQPGWFRWRRWRHRAIWLLDRLVLGRGANSGLHSGSPNCKCLILFDVFLQRSGLFLNEFLFVDA